MTAETAVLITLTILVLSVGYVVRRLHRMASTLSRLETDMSSQAGETRRSMESVAATIVKQGPRFDSPLARLTFTESLDPRRFAEASTAAAKASLTNSLESRAADGIVLSIQSIRLIQQGAEMIVSASAAGRQLLTETRAVIPYSANGARLPLLTDKRTGRVIEQLKETQISTITSRLASVSTMALAAAHLVAGADIAKRLARVESKLDLLIATRAIDQLARLERIYIAAQELGAHELDRGRRLEMWRLRGDLRELRSAWRQDFRSRLARIEDPTNAGWLRSLFSTQRSVDERVKRGISDGEAEVALVEYSLRLEYVLAVGSDTIDEYRHSQESELQQLAQLLDELQQKASYISGKYADLSVDSMVQALSAVLAAYRTLQPLSDHQRRGVIDASAF
jgi:hypothetical protein